MTSAPSASGHGMNVWFGVGSFVFALLRLNALLTLTMLPMLILVMGAADPLGSYPFLFLCLWASSPGIAAMFTAYRDCPGLSFSRHDSHEFLRAQHEGVMAWPYWIAADGSGVVKPFFRAYRKLAVRALISSAVTLGFSLACIFYLSFVRVHEWGQYVSIPLAVGAGLGILVWQVALVAVGEFPKARMSALLRNSFVLSVKTIYLTVINLAVLALTFFAVLYQPILALMLASGLLLYVVWANSRWALMPLMQALNDEAPPVPCHGSDDV
ncbi:hypothetical protein [Actinomyces vulturis]|uniref:hypothetical protein n=1 Tax=Actinomyces vulturis TaxID=1857645 RepID=UPI00083596E8|nr:hypothetical protein [Actinomyces vulturis]